MWMAFKREQLEKQQTGMLCPRVRRAWRTLQCLRGQLLGILTSLWLWKYIWACIENACRPLGSSPWPCTSCCPHAPPAAPLTAAEGINCVLRGVPTTDSQVPVAGPMFVLFSPCLFPGIFPHHMGFTSRWTSLGFLTVCSLGGRASPFSVLLPPFCIPGAFAFKGVECVLPAWSGNT